MTGRPSAPPGFARRQDLCQDASSRRFGAHGVWLQHPPGAVACLVAEGRALALASRALDAADDQSDLGSGRSEAGREMSLKSSELVLASPAGRRESASLWGRSQGAVSGGGRRGWSQGPVVQTARSLSLD